MISSNSNSYETSWLRLISSVFNEIDLLSHFIIDVTANAQRLETTRLIINFIVYIKFNAIGTS